ncbi:MAG: methyl-accepting chemotaxis protein [Devosia sp.]|nr:methyl-accepting chemotaxis protein [Devosia sp.]
MGLEEVRQKIATAMMAATIIFALVIAGTERIVQGNFGLATWIVAPVALLLIGMYATSRRGQAFRYAVVSALMAEVMAFLISARGQPWQIDLHMEAARAGEAGKGFAVVAIEVRRLAQSAAGASSEIKALIEQSGTEVSGGSKLVADAAQKLTEMLQAARSSSELMDGIAKGSHEQASAIEEVTSAVRQMDEMTQHNAALVEEINASIEQTESQASDLDRIVDVFTLENAGGSGGRQGPLAQPANANRPPAPMKAKPGGGVKAMQEKVKQAANSYLRRGGAAAKEDWSEF